MQTHKPHVAMLLSWFMQKMVEFPNLFILQTIYLKLTYLYLFSENLCFCRARLHQLRKCEFHSCNDGERASGNKSFWSARAGFQTKPVLQIPVSNIQHWSLHYKHMLSRARFISWLLLAHLQKWSTRTCWNWSANTNEWRHNYLQVRKLVNEHEMVIEYKCSSLCTKLVHYFRT